jgi:hypothetical protein
MTGTKQHLKEFVEQGRRNDELKSTTAKLGEDAC